MNLFFLDTNPQAHQLPNVKLGQGECPRFTSSAECVEYAARAQDALGILHARDDWHGVTGAKLAAGGCAVYYFSMEAADALSAAESARAQLDVDAAGLVDWCELEHLRSGIIAAALSGDFSEVTSHRAIENRVALEALAILSQGYFATTAIQDQNGNWGPRTIDDILGDIGWCALARDPAGAVWRESLPARASDVAKPSWWRDALGLTREQLTSKLRVETGQTLDRNKPLERLLEAIYPKAGDAPLKMETVARAFRCIGALLRE